MMVILLGSFSNPTMQIFYRMIPFKSGLGLLSRDYFEELTKGQVLTQVPCKKTTTKKKKRCQAHNLNLWCAKSRVASSGSGSRVEGFFTV